MAGRDPLKYYENLAVDDLQNHLAACKAFSKNKSIDPFDGQPITRQRATDLRKMCAMVRRAHKKVSSPKRVSSPKIGRRIYKKKADCLPPNVWTVGKGCFTEAVRQASSRQSSPRHAKKNKLRKADCLPPNYKWIVGKGCFGN